MDGVDGGACGGGGGGANPYVLCRSLKQKKKLKLQDVYVST